MPLVVSLVSLSLGVAVVSLALSYGSCRLLAFRGVVDVPNNRSSHTSPTPTGAGIGLAAAWLLVAGFIVWRQPSHPPEMIAALAMPVAFALLGLADDLRGLSPWVRLLSQTLIAVVAVLAGLQTPIVSLGGLGAIHLGSLAAPLCVIGFVGTVNLYNFMDGIDGLAAGHALVAALMLAVGAVILNSPFVALLAGLLGAVAGGFLPLNWHPARCFMGDSGSYFLGATLAGLLVLGQRSGVPLPLVGLASFGFLLDAAGTLGFRLARGHSPLQAHRSHVYQRLVDSGWSQARVSAVYMTFAAATGTVGLAILNRT